MEINVISHILFTIFCSLVLFFYGFACLRDRRLILLSISVFILKSIIVYLFFQVPGFIESNFFTDSKAYYQAVAKTNNYFQIFSSPPSVFTYNLWDTQVNYFYILVVSPFYWCFPSASTGILLNSLFYLLAFNTFYKLFFNREDNENSVIGFALLLFWPSMFFNSLLFIRDGLIVFLIGLFFTYYCKRLTLSGFLIIVLCIFLEVAIRWYVGVSLLLFVMGEAALSIGKKYRLFLPIIAIAFVVGLGVAINRFGVTLDLIQAFRNIKTGAEGSYNANSVYLRGYIIDSVPKLIFFIPLASLYFLYSPLIPAFSNPLSLPAFVENVVLLFMSAFIFLPNRRISGYRFSDVSQKLFLFSIPLLFIYSFGVADSGTAIRQKGFIVLVIVFSFYKKRSWAKR